MKLTSYSNYALRALQLAALKAPELVRIEDVARMMRLKAPKSLMPQDLLDAGAESFQETGKTLLYKSVKNLLKNLQFLPALPKSYPEDSYKFGIRFSPANFK